MTPLWGDRGLAGISAEFKEVFVMKRYYDGISKVFAVAAIIALMKSTGGSELRAGTGNSDPSYEAAICALELGTSICKGDFRGCPIGQICNTNKFPVSGPNGPTCCY